jgi:chromosome segregation ATPase
MMNNQKWSLGIVGIAIATGIVTASSVSAETYNHDTGGTRILNSPTFNTGGSTSGGGDSSPARRATTTSASELSNRIQQVRDRIAAIKEAQQAAEEGPVRIARRNSEEDDECLDQQELEELERELDSLLKEAQQLTEEQNQTQPNNGSW